jgi:predicted permease
MSLIWREAFQTFRALSKKPLVPALAVLSVAFGIGANSVFFGLIDLLILRPIAVPHPEELVRVSTISPTGSAGDYRLLLPMFQALHDRGDVFEGIFAWNDDALRNMQSGDVRFLGEVDEVSGDFFRTLGERPLLGRLINDGDVALGSGQSARIAVLSNRCWREHYHSDPHVVGKTIIADGIPLTVIGVTNRDFSEIDIDVTSDAIVPIGFSHDGVKRGWYNVTGRLKPGVSLTQARSEVSTLWPSILASTVQPTMAPDARARYLARRIELASEYRGDSSLREKYSQPLILLMSLAGMILLITCINLASVMLARTMSRRPAFQVRLALGATHWAILRLVLLEAVFISLSGALIGASVAIWSARLLIDLLWTGFVSPGLHMTINIRVLIFLVGATILTAVLFGLIPAIRATLVNSSPACRSDRGGATGRFRVGKGLIITQVVFAFVLVTAALVLAATLHSLRVADLGYDRGNVLVMTLFPQSKLARPSDTATYYRQLASELQKIPGTKSVSFAQSAPAFNFEFAYPVSTSGVEVPALSDSVAPDFFHLLRISVLKGREFEWQDDERTPRAAILSENLASRLFPHEDPIGKMVNFGENASGKGLTVVGVVQDAGLWKPQTPHPMAIYLPLMQVCSGCSPLALVRTDLSPMAIAHVSEHTVQSMGYQYSVRTQSLEEKFNKMLAVQRLSSWLSVAFGIAALLLASLGLYGLISYIVEMRTKEIGIRIALGANRGGVLFLVLYDAQSIVVIGVLIGIPAGWAISRSLASKYVYLSHGVVNEMLCSTLILLLAAFFAGYLPALRASRTDPASALRAE